MQFPVWHLTVSGYSSWYPTETLPAFLGGELNRDRYHPSRRVFLLCFALLSPPRLDSARTGCGMWEVGSRARQQPHWVAMFPGAAQKLVPGKCHSVLQLSLASLSLPPPFPFSSLSAPDGGQLSSSSPTQHHHHISHSAPSGLQEAGELFLRSWHSAWLSPL